MTPLVSVIVVNWNGRDHLRPCFRSLLASRYPSDRLELILVDNASTDGSRELMATEFPSVKLVALETNRGFTGGNNAGVASARGDVLIFFNNDIRVDALAIPRLVSALDAEHPCTAARVLSWNGRSIDFVSGSINFEARGFQEHFGQRNSPELTAVKETFFPNGSAFAITREAFQRCGGFDDHFFAYYDDVDLGWRVRLAGGRIRVASDAIVYHRHGATGKKFAAEQKQFLMDRNALWTVMKNYEDATLRRTLASALLLSVGRIVQQTSVRRRTTVARRLAPFSRCCRPSRHSGRAWRARDVYEHIGGEGEREQKILRRMPVAPFAALGSGLAELPAVRDRRHAVQQARRVPDADILPEFGRSLEYSSSGASYVAAQDALTEALELSSLFQARSRVLLITHEPLQSNMSGPGVRVLEMGRALARTMRVTIATPFEPQIRDDLCAIARYRFDDPASIRRLAEDTDVIVLRGFTLVQFPFLSRMTLPLVVDLYCPFTLEHLEMTRERGNAESSNRVAPVELEASELLSIQNEQLLFGDFFLCASERQRDFWIGALHTAGRVNPRTYAADPTLRRLIDVVPFGVPEAIVTDASSASPRHLKGIHPGIRAGDRVLLWAGAILDWQDPQTLIRAVARLSRYRDDVKLFFMGTKHPNPQVAPMRAIEESLGLARSLGVLDTHVFFNDWVAYDQRAGYLLDADLGMSTHRDHLETRFSFRTRMLDYIWSGLPIVCTKGDYFSELVQQREIGLTVSPSDIDALEAAITRLLDEEALRARCRANLRQLADELRWSRVIEPLKRFCDAPIFAPDREFGIVSLRDQLKRGFRLSKWIKRTALHAGLSEYTIERLKQTGLARVGIGLRNRLAWARARRAVKDRR